MSLARYKERALRLLGRQPAAFREVAEKQWTVAPATHSTVPPAIYTESDLDRVTGVMSDTTIDYEFQRVRGGPRQHIATTAFQIRDVQLRDGYFHKGSWNYRLLKDPRSTPGAAELHLPEAAIGCSLFGNVYFAHWITDDLTLHLAAQSLAPPLAVERKPYSHEPGYRELFQIPPATAARAHVDRFLMLEDFGQNHFKAERYRTLRDRIRIASGAVPGAHPRIYLRRGTTGVPRILVNTPEVEDCLLARGYLLVDPEKETPAQIARLTNGARIAISVEGSHMVHGFLNLAEGGAICQIQPPYRFNNLFKDYTDCLGMHYAFTVGLPAEGGFTLPIADLNRLLDRVESLP